MSNNPKAYYNFQTGTSESTGKKLGFPLGPQSLRSAVIFTLPAFHAGTLPRSSPAPQLSRSPRGPLFVYFEYFVVFSPPENPVRQNVTNAT